MDYKKISSAVIGWLVMIICSLVMCKFSESWHIAFRASLLIAWTICVSNCAYKRGYTKSSETKVDRENVILVLNQTAKKVMAQTAANIFAELERRHNPNDKHLSREEYRDAIIQRTSDEILENLKNGGDFFS